MSGMDNGKAVSSLMVEQPLTQSPAPDAPAPKRGTLLALARNREIQRVVAFLFAGGVSAICTIAVTRALNTTGPHLTYLLAVIIGTEVGILINFMINDRLAFRDLDGKGRPLPVRLARFHVTCATGQGLIIISAFLLKTILRWDGSVAQAVPIVLVTGVNFALHRFWTYRGARSVKAAQ